jgi:hypothetical protein
MDADKVEVNNTIKSMNTELIKNENNYREVIKNLNLENASLKLNYNGSIEDVKIVIIIFFQFIQSSTYLL